MARHLMQTSYAALLATALATPVWAQDAAITPTAETEQELGGGAGAAGSVVGGGGEQPAATDVTQGTDDTADMDGAADMEATGTATDAPVTGADSGSDEPAPEGTEPTITGSGQNTGSAADSGGSAESASLTRTQLATDLRAGQIGQDVVETLETTTRLQILPLSEVDAAGGASMATAEEGNPPMTGGRTTNETVEGSGGAPGSAAGTAGQSTASPAGISEGLATGTTQVMGTSMGTRTDLDEAMDEAGDSRQALQAALQQDARIVEMLEAEGHAADQVIAVYRTENGVEIIVDDRSE
ncbi:hypothetical protein E4191_21635 (plasmid) [Paracoccus liaowanqingii]|uniref:Uncharacterized protein n=1 Tax=Paracoccus liaowanqingii TaxID=2560053 RepID=A0A4Y5ST49_9RHOB|nr:hypothetical protein [Paracoccus liaowanqingii]QDA36692.1 hypothetical protein E4191_21635 [Paracoccus liaowanqingii]